jgi:eukaryotic-like serine/threonine-protein kinase
VFKFITNKSIWVNILAAVSLAILLIIIVLQLLGWITKHGEYLTVPGVIGKDYQQSIVLLESKGFDVVIQDSVFTDTISRGAIIKQLPDSNATVKINRTVFITVNRYIPPMVIMPMLEGRSFGFALELLKRNHLQLGDTTFKADFMKGTVLEQEFKGYRIAAGAKVQWGSRINLVIAGGLMDQETMVPDLIGLTYAEAKAQLELLGVNIAGIIGNGLITDTASAFVYKQNPEPVDEEKRPLFIRSGQLMDLYISSVKTFSKDTVQTINK